MKKPNISLLTIITFIFVAFLAGFFLGRNLFRGDVLVSVPVITPPEKLSNEEVIPTYSEKEDTIVNINTAGIYELASLPGIGESLAQRIVDYRNSHGNFTAPEELLNVSGIGSTKLESILDKITTGGLCQ